MIKRPMPRLKKDRDGFARRESNTRRVHIIHAKSNDWCHCCGYRCEHLVDVFTWDNAEHALLNPSVARQKKYMRICDGCVAEMSSVLKAREAQDAD